MAQDFSTTRLAHGVPADSIAPSANEGQRPRRRLGGWQIGDTLADPLESTGDLSPAIDVADGSQPAVLPDAAMTAPLARTPGRAEFVTAPISKTSTPPQSAGVADTVDLLRHDDGSRDFTERLLAVTGIVTSDPLALAPSESGTATVSLSSSAASPVHGVDTRAILSDTAATAPFQDLDPSGGGGTAPMRGITAHIARARTAASGDRTAEIAVATSPIATSPVGKTIGIGRAPSVATESAPGQARVGTAELARDPASHAGADVERLRARVAANPGDSDALFELAVFLHRAGLRADARTALTQLVQLYETRGQHQQAARIKTMLGTPKTGPIATDDLPPRPPDGSRTSSLPHRTSSLVGRASAQETARTGALKGRTVALQYPTAAIGRAKEAARTKGVGVHAFPPEALLFTIPLPGQDRLPQEARDILENSEQELTEKRYLAALDSCIEVIGLAPGYTPVYLRLAEIYTRQRLMRRARAQAEALIRLADAANDRLDLWMIYRVLLHASGGDTQSLRRLVELLIEAGKTEQASIYASRLIQILEAEGLHDEALGYSVRLCELVPGDTRAALENAILRLKSGDRGGALDRWESAVAAGADAVVAKASVAALTAAVNEDDHWRILSEVLPIIRQHHDAAIVDAYVRTAAVMPESPTLIAGHGLMLLANGDPNGRDQLVQAAGARAGAAISRAAAAVALGWSLAQEGRIDEYVAAVRTALKLLQSETVANHPAWEGLVGRVPRFVDLSLELGEVLLGRGDAAGAAELLKAAHECSRQHPPVCELLAEAYFKTGQLGSALTVLDGLAVHFRSTGQLEAMAGVLRQMSQLAPNNIKVKSRLIEAYLQRGFVAEARAELIQRADLEARSGLIKDAVTSLSRAADLSWTIGLAEETFTLYARVVAMMPDDVGNRSSLVNYYLQMGRLTDAAEHQRAVVDIALRGGHKHEAIAALHQVIGLTPDDTSAYYQLADLLVSMGEFHQAEKVYRRLLLMNPADAIAQAKATSMAALRETQAT